MTTAYTDNIREDYAAAASQRVTLCSTDAYKRLDLSWVPPEVLERNQGCTSPFLSGETGLRSGDTVVDLGCGAGLDAFLAAKAVGANGRVIGIDMTAEMLAVAVESIPAVTRALGYPEPNVRFERSFMETLPLADNSVDVILSNCVINLSSDKEAVFRGIFRVLKPGGRMIISDVFATQPVPLYIQHDRTLISQCIGGAMEVRAFLQAARAAGLRGVRHSHAGGYSKVDGIDFSSITMTAQKPEVPATQGDAYVTLLGPCSAVIDELGNRFVRGETRAVTAPVASVLKKSPYRDFFYVSADPAAIDKDSCQGVLPRTGPCVYKGDFVTLVGPFTAIEDDDGHRFAAGEPQEICEKTVEVLAHPLYDRLFVKVNRAAGRGVAGEAVDCGTNCC